MSKRNAFRIGYNPHSADSVVFTVQRYGAIERDTLVEILAWLDKNKDTYTYRVENNSASIDGTIVTFPVLVTNRKGSAIEKYIDNQHDASNTLANIRNVNFPKNKQGQ